MSAVYTADAFENLIAPNILPVTTWYTTNPGKSIEDGVTALDIPYEVVYECINQAGLVIFPNTSGELQFNPGRGRSGA